MSPRDVFVLGAGFSKAISSDMPLVDELGNHCKWRLGGDAPHRFPTRDFDNGRFETYLSRIGEDQPDLSEAENIDNRALFLRFTEAIGEYLRECLAKATEQDCPGWLLGLLEALHRRQATVLTFNYDTLLEAAVQAHHLVSPPLGGAFSTQVFWDDIVDHLPPLPAGAMLQEPGIGFSLFKSDPHSLRTTFTLLKLHGSINWYWQPGDETGATLNRWTFTGRFGSNEQENEVVRRRLLPGRVPFVVPPAASKSAYYRNPLTREIWERAAAALGVAERVVLIGYSLPPTDLVFSGMFWEKVGVRDVPVEIVDPDPDRVRERLVAMGVAPDRVVTNHVGEDCVPSFSQSYARSDVRAV